VQVLLLGAMLFAATLPLAAIRTVHDAQCLCIGALRLFQFRDRLFRSFLGGFEFVCDFFQACNTVVVFRLQCERSMRVLMVIVTRING